MSDTISKIIEEKHAQAVTGTDAAPALTMDEWMTGGIVSGAITCHEAAKTWWLDQETGEDVRTWPQKFFKLWVSTKLFLIVSEVVEAFEGYRKDVMDTHLTERKMFVVELADTFIRLFDLIGGLGLAAEVAKAIIEKLAYNAQRADHKPENRKKKGGKQF